MAIDPHTKYLVTISAQGKPSVSIECDDPLGAAEAVSRILRTYAQIDAPTGGRATGPLPARRGRRVGARLRVH